MAARQPGESKRGATTAAEELEFRYRSLVSAERILEGEGRPRGGSAALRAHRLRHLRLYIRNAIATVERQMHDLGITPPERAEIEGSEPFGGVVERNSRDGLQLLTRES